MLNIIEQIIDELLSQKREKPLTNAERIKRNNASLVKDSELGRSALELEQSKGFQDIIPPYTKEVLKNGINTLIVQGLTMTKDQINIVITEMVSAINIHALIKDVKDKAVAANTILKERGKKEAARKEKDKALTGKQKERSKVIERIEGGEK